MLAKFRHAFTFGWHGSAGFLKRGAVLVPSLETPWVAFLRIHFGRFVIRAGFPFAKAYWYVFAPAVRGSKCLIEYDGKILLVKHSYGPDLWTLPGGGVKRNETPEDGAHREVREETGLALARIFKLGEEKTRPYRKHKTTYFFYAESFSPDLALDRMEIEEAGWFGPFELPYPVGTSVVKCLNRLREFQSDTTLLLNRTSVTIKP